MTHALTLPNCSPLTQTTASHSIPNIPPFYPCFLIPESPSVAIVCCVCLPACWSCVRTAVGMNDCRYHVVWPWGIQNLSLLCLLSNAGLSGSKISILLALSCVWILGWCISSAKIVLCVCHESMISCVYAFLPSPHPSWCSCWVCLVLFGCVPTPARRSEVKTQLAVAVLNVRAVVLYMYPLSHFKM